MDQRESSLSRHDNTVGNSGRPHVFHTTRLCEKLVLPKGDFDLTDPNGYKLSTTYNCLHDPNLKDYMYRKDIHKHLLKDGFITKNDKVTCSLKEFRTYRNYLREIQLDLDQRFKMEQRSLVRRILILQQEGRVSPDISVPDFIEWLHSHGQQQDVGRKPQSCGNNTVKLPKLKKKNRPLYDDEEDRVRWRSILEEVTQEVQRELRLEHRWRGRRQQNWYEPRASLRARALGDSLTRTGYTPVLEDTVAQQTILARRPTLKRLSPLPYRRKSVQAVYSKGRVSRAGRGTSHRRTDVSRSRSEASIITPPVTPETTNALYKHEGSYGDSMCVLSMSPCSEQLTNQGKDKIHNAQNLTEKHPQLVTDIVDVMMSGIVTTVVPVMQQFMQTCLSAVQTGSKDNTVARHCHHLSRHAEIAQRDDDISQHARSVAVKDEKDSLQPPNPIHQSNTETTKSEKAESPLSGELGLKTDLMQKAERVIWRATHEVMRHIKSGGSACALHRAESDFGRSVSEEPGYDLESSASPSTQEGACSGERACSSSISQLPVSLANAKTRSDAEACREHMCTNATAKNTQQGNNCWNQGKTQSPKLKHCSSGCKLSGTTLRNFVYEESVDDILEKVSSLVADETIEAISKTQTDRSSSAVSSSTLSSSSSSRIKRIVQDCVTAGWKEHNELVQRGESGSPKRPVGSTIRLHAAIPHASEEEVAPYADDMVMDIIDQIRNLCSSGTEYSGTPDSFITSKGSSGNFSVHHEAVNISHQIFSDMKSQLDQLRFNNEASEDKAILCEYIDLALNKLNDMHEPKWQFLTQAVEMKSSVTERSRGCESPRRDDESLTAVRRMENVKMQFEKAARQPVKATLESVLSGFFGCNADPAKFASSENTPPYQNNLRSLDDLSPLTSDIVMIMWQTLIDASTCGAQSDSSRDWEANLNSLIKAISEVSSSVNNNRVQANPATLKAELTLQSINLAIETKLKQFVTKQSEGDKKATDKAPSAPRVHRSVEGIKNFLSEPLNVCGQEVRECVVSSPSEHTFKHSRGHISAKKTHSTFQFAHPLNAHSSADVPNALSKSSVPLITDTCGDQVESLTIKKEGSVFLTDPTVEGLAIHPNTNRRDLAVQRFAVEELSPLCLAALSASMSSRRDYESSMQTPQEAFHPGLPEQADAVGHASTLAWCPPAMLYLIKLTIETLVSKVLDKCMLGSELLTEWGLLSCDTPVPPHRSRAQSATSGDETRNVPHRHRVQEAMLASAALQEGLSNTVAKPGKDCRPHSAAADLRGVEQISGPRSNITRHVFCSSQELHSPRRLGLQSQTQACSASGTLLNPLSMFWKNFRKAQPAVSLAADGSGPGLSPSKASAVPQQGNGDKVKSPLPAPCPDNSIPQPGPVKDIMISLWVHIHSDGPAGPSDSSSSLDPSTLKLFDNLLPQLEVFWHDLLHAEGVEQLSCGCIDARQVAWSIYEDLVSYCGGREDLRRAVAAPEEHLVARLVSSLAQLLTQCIQSMKHDLASTRPSSLASTRLSSPSSWVTEEACTISEDITLRSVDLITPGSTCSLELAEDLMDAVMVELCTDPEMFGSPEPEPPNLDWPQLSLAELNQAATDVYKYMLEQCGSVENLQSALRSREKLVVANMAVAIATQTYKIISMKENNGNHVQEPSETPVNESRGTPVPSQSSNRSASVSLGISPQPTPSQCSIFYQTVWDIVSTLILELCKKKAHRQHLTPKLFLRALTTLSECPGVKISNDKKLCDVSGSSANAIERVVLAARRRLCDHPDDWSALESLLSAKDEDAIGRVVITVVEEILTFASHPFGTVTVSEAEGELGQGLPPHDLELCPSVDVSDGVPDMDMSTDMSPEPITSKSRLSSAAGSKKVTFLPFTKIDYFTKSERKPKMADEAEHPVSLKNRKVISVKVKKHSKKGRAPRPKRPKSHEDDQSVRSEESREGHHLGLGAFLSKFFQRH